MALFIDSAIVDEVREAVGWGFVAGVTTNPGLMALAQRPAEDVIKELCRLTDGPVFYQVTKNDPPEREAEARHFAAISPGQVVLKIPCTLSGLALAARLSPEIPCAATAIFSAAQTFLALEAGARYVIPYVNRATRLMGDGLALVRTMADIVACSGREAEVLAASLKTPDEVTSAILAGARHVTIPLSVIEAMAEHEFTVAAIEEFARAQAG
ncbi:MAG: transaldolase family protein [Chloroflexota bacterium]